MRKLLIIIGLAFTLNAQAQKVDTVRNAVLVKPVLMNWINKDTAYQITWQLFQVSRDTAIGCNSYVEVFDRKGKKLMEKNVPIDRSTLHYYPNLAPIDKYIAFALGLELK